MTVHLVGAGPGDPDLLTLRAARLLAEADVVVFDALVDHRILDLVHPDAELIDVGKRPGLHIAQDNINALLVLLGNDPTRCIVRLKGGDPYVFGRGAEEAASLAAAGVGCHVVPGVSSAFGVPAAAGIPVTHRGLSPAVTVLTGHRPSGEVPIDWASFGRSQSTLVILMGMSERAEIAGSLIAGGMSPDTPVAIIERGTQEHQRDHRSVLSDLPHVDAAAPATIVIGAVAAIRGATYLPRVRDGALANLGNRPAPRT
jgi:uroporphyrin-III C-methyltransferase